jgi:hypothetical protein
LAACSGKLDLRLDAHLEFHLPRAGASRGSDSPAGLLRIPLLLLLLLLLLWPPLLLLPLLPLLPLLLLLLAAAAASAVPGCCYITRAPPPLALRGPAVGWMARGRGVF